MIPNWQSNPIREVSCVGETMVLSNFQIAFKWRFRNRQRFTIIANQCHRTLILLVAIRWYNRSDSTVVYATKLSSQRETQRCIVHMVIGHYINSTLANKLNSIFSLFFMNSHFKCINLRCLCCLPSAASSHFPCAAVAASQKHKQFHFTIMTNERTHNVFSCAHSFDFVFRHAFSVFLYFSRKDPRNKSIFMRLKPNDIKN